jgi:hypothetical protein
MPYYVFRDINTEETFEKLMKISELDQYKLDNPHLQTVPQAPGFSDPVRLGRMKPSDGFRDVLQKIKQGSPRSRINTYK